MQQFHTTHPLPRKGAGIPTVGHAGHMSDSAAPWTGARQAPRCPWGSPGKKARVGCHSLLQGIFLTQGSNPGLLHCRQVLYRLSHHGSPICNSNDTHLSPRYILKDGWFLSTCWCRGGMRRPGAKFDLNHLPWMRLGRSLLLRVSLLTGKSGNKGFPMAQW